ncbi:MAG TPA: four helix bundle protein [candidate division Zixibacteria bacterium]
MGKEQKDFNFRNLIVWQKAVDLVDRIYSLTGSFPQSENKILIPQLLRAVNSIPSNIAEGNGRKSRKEFVQYLYFAKGSLAETLTFLEIAKRRNYLDMSDYIEINEACVEIQKLIVALINKYSG